MLEDNNKPQEAYETYADTLTELREAKSLSGKERLRTVAIAHKLGEMAEAYQQPAGEEERWLVYAVEELLRILRDEHVNTQLAVPTHDADKEHQTIITELELPKWVEKIHIVAPLQALGTFYNRTGKQEYGLSVLCILCRQANALADMPCRYISPL